MGSADLGQEGEQRCPKNMTFGPCGGVDAEQQCEVPGVRCPFPRAVEWTGGHREPEPPTWRWIVDLRLRREDLGRLEACGAKLGHPRTTVLLGEHVDDDTRWSPSEQVRWAVEHLGLRPLVTVTCRDRTSTELGNELERSVAAGASGVHCVTGDHPAARFGRGVHADFAVDSFGLLAMASELGVTLTAAESPQAPPVADRPGRAAGKVAAGADAVIANHVDDDDLVARFAERVRRSVHRAAVVAAVPLLIDKDSVRRLVQFPGVHLHGGDVETVMEADDPVTTGVEVAASRARALLRHPGIFGVNLSGTGVEDPLARVEIVEAITSAADD